MTDLSPAMPAHRMVDFQEAVRLGFQNYVKFEGRSSRGAYWYWALFAMILSIVTGLIDGLLFPATMGSPLNTIASLATILPGIAVGVRRLHDIGRSGWWILIALTVIGVLLLIYWNCQPGQRSDNAFGADKEAGRA